MEQLDVALVLEPTIANLSREFVQDAVLRELGELVTHLLFEPVGPVVGTPAQTPGSPWVVGCIVLHGMELERDSRILP